MTAPSLPPNHGRGWPSERYDWLVYARYAQSSTLAAWGCIPDRAVAQ
jgi:hypothetical protein